MTRKEIESKAKETIQRLYGDYQDNNYTYIKTQVIELMTELGESLVKNLDIGCVSKCADMKPPHLKQKQMQIKKERAKYLKTLGYSVREIMEIMSYKSPRSIQILLED